MSNNKRLRSDRISGWEIYIPLLIAVLILFGTHHWLFAVAAFAICCMTMLLANNTFIISLLFFIMPMAGIFKVEPETTSLFTYLELLFVILHIYKKKFRLTYGELMTLFFGGYVVITAYAYSALNVTRTIKIMMNLMLIGYFAEQDPEHNHKGVFLAYIFGIIISSLMRFADSSFFPITEYAAELTESYGGMTTIRFAGLYGDPNYYSINIIIAMSLLTVLYRREDLSFFQTVGLMAPLLLFVGLTGSKSSFLMLLLPIFLLLYVCVKNRNYAALAGSILLLFIVAFLVTRGIVDAFDYVLNRMKFFTSWNSFTTGRMAIWRSYLQFFKENPVRTIFGTGAAIHLLNDTAPHNTFIDFIFLFGITGTILYIPTFYFNIRKNKRRIQRNLLNCGVFLTIAVMYAFLSELQSYDFPFHLALASMAWNLDVQ